MRFPLVCLLGFTLVAAPAAWADEPAPPPETTTTTTRSMGEYIRYGVMGAIPVLDLVEEEYVDAVEAGDIPATFVGALLAPLGGHIWAPKIFYGDAPESDAATAAFRFGLVSLALAWLPIVALPLLLIPVVGWFGYAVISAFELVYQFNMAPRMIALAYSDAIKQQGTPPAAPPPASEAPPASTPAPAADKAEESVEEDSDAE